MEITLTSFEIEILDKVIPTQKLNAPDKLKLVLQALVNDEKDRVMASGNFDENSFRNLQIQVSKNIIDFLKTNDFYFEKELGTFPTEKLRRLIQQGSLAKYIEWKQLNAQVTAQDINAISARGFLDRKQDEALQKDVKWKDMQSVDYLLENKELTKKHAPLSSHKFRSKEAQEAEKKKDSKSFIYPILIALVVLVLALLARHYKII